MLIFVWRLEFGVWCLTKKNALTFNRYFVDISLKNKVYILKSEISYDYFFERRFEKLLISFDFEIPFLIPYLFSKCKQKRFFIT